MSLKNSASYVLPWPPSVNHIWRTSRGRFFKSQKYEAWRQQAWLIIKSHHWRCHGTVSVHIEASPPDNRKRDLDNVLKPILDILTTADVIVDDSCQVVREINIRFVPGQAGECKVIVTQLDHDV